MHKFPYLIHGADYNPDQWLKYEGIIDEDFRLLKLANMNSVSVGIFSWAKLEPQEGVYDFEWLDDIFRRVNEINGKVVLATPSGARPQWLAQKYPEVLRTNEKREKALFGARHNHCYTSPVYREKVANINSLLAKRYANDPALFVWHLSNEYGGECHCELCQQAFREWLKSKYNNDLNKLNEQYWSAFWSHTYTDWSQVESPSPIGEQSVHGLNLDWKRFVTYQTTDFIKMERDAVKKHTPDIPVTANLMGTYYDLNYHKLAKEIDIVSWDSYPRWGINEELNVAIETAFCHDLMRGCGNGKPFMLMECTPSLVNWHDVNKLKRPRQHKLASLQAIGHGSDSVQYFQFRKSRGSSEKLHGAVVDHCGHENTRVFREVSEVGTVLRKLNNVVGSVVKSDVAIVFDWENRWALNDCQALKNGGEDPKDYVKIVMQHYKYFWENGVSVDIASLDTDFSKYKTVIVPMLYMLPEVTGERLCEFVKNGGNLVTTFFSGVVNENDLVHLGGLPGAGLGEVCGIWSEEIDTLYEGQKNLVTALDKIFEATDYCEIIHTKTAEILGEYTTDFYEGTPALTKNKYGNGTAYYMAFRGGDDFLKSFYDYFVKEHNVRKNLDTDLPYGVTVTKRIGENGKFLFIQNFENKEKIVELGNEAYTDVLTGEMVMGNLTMEALGVRVLYK